MNITEGAETEAVPARRVDVAIDGDVRTRGRDFESFAHLSVQLKVRDGAPVLGRRLAGEQPRHAHICTPCASNHPHVMLSKSATFVPRLSFKKIWLEFEHSHGIAANTIRPQHAYDWLAEPSTTVLLLLS